MFPIDNHWMNTLGIEARFSGLHVVKEMGIRRHLDTGFEIWTGQRTWFWLVANPGRNGGSIGAAATEAEAIREACLSIEEMSAQRRAGAASHVTAKNTFTPCHQSNAIELAAIGWECSLASLERYLAGLCANA